MIYNDFGIFVILAAIDQVAAVGGVDFFAAAVLFVKIGDVALFALAHDVQKRLLVDKTIAVTDAGFAAGDDPVDGE